MFVKLCFCTALSPNICLHSLFSLHSSARNSLTPSAAHGGPQQVPDARPPPSAGSLLLSTPSLVCSLLRLATNQNTTPNTATPSMFLKIIPVLKPHLGFDILLRWHDIWPSRAAAMVEAASAVTRYESAVVLKPSLR